jgi:hypothetical protein
MFEGQISETHRHKKFHSEISKRESDLKDNIGFGFCLGSTLSLFGGTFRPLGRL